MQITQSHRHRCMSSFVCPKLKTRDCQRYRVVDELGPNNVVVTKHMVVTYHPDDQLRQYKVSDFTLSNLQRIGAQLNPKFAVQENRFTFVDTATKMFDTLSNLNINDK